jgi:hypothetical protein
VNPGDREEYERRLALRETRKREVEQACGFTTAPAQPVRRRLRLSLSDQPSEAR